MQESVLNYAHDMHSFWKISHELLCKRQVVHYHHRHQCGSRMLGQGNVTSFARELPERAKRTPERAYLNGKRCLVVMDRKGLYTK